MPTPLLRTVLIALTLAAAGLAQPQIEQAERLIEAGRRHKAFLALERFLEDSPRSSRARYRLAEIYFTEQDYQNAANEFRECANGDQKPQWTLVWAHINLGRTYDLVGQRTRALRNYRLAVRTGDNTQDAQAVAKRHLEKRYEHP